MFLTQKKAHQSLQMYYSKNLPLSIILFSYFIYVSESSHQLETNTELSESSTYPKQVWIGQKRDGISRGIFETFLRNWLKLLTWRHIKVRRLRDYCKILEEELCHMDYRFTAKLADYFKTLSKTNGRAIQDELRSYKDELESKTPRRQVEFFIAINRAFSPQEEGQFFTYLYELKDWLQDRKNYISTETYDVIKSIIIDNILKKLNVREQIALEKKLKRALRNRHGGGAKKSQSEDLGFPERILTLENLRNYTFNIDDFLYVEYAKGKK